MWILPSKSTIIFFAGAYNLKIQRLNKNIYISRRQTLLEVGIFGEPCKEHDRTYTFIKARTHLYSILSDGEGATYPVTCTITATASHFQTSGIHMPVGNSDVDGNFFPIKLPT